MCYAKYGKEIFCDNLEDREECIYHKLVRGYDDLMKEFERGFGTKVVIMFKDKGTM